MMAHELPALPETTYKLGRQGGANPYGDGYEPDWVLPQAAYDADQMRAYATAHAASLEAEVARLRLALEDMLAGWKYIRRFHGDLYGVGWDRAQNKAEVALNPAALEGS